MLFRICLAAVIAGFVVPGYAADAIKVDMSAPILELAGKPSKDGSNRTEAQVKADPECTKCPDLTMGNLISTALYRSTSADPRAPMEMGQIMARVDLAKSLRDPLTGEDNKAAMLGAAQVRVIEEAVAKAFPGLALAQVIKAIDPNYKAPELK